MSDNPLTIFLQDGKKIEVRSYTYIYIKILEINICRNLYNCVYIYTITYIYMNFRKTYMCVYLCRSTLRSHSRYALFIVDCLGFKGLRRGRKGGLFYEKKTVLKLFQSGEFKSIRVFTNSLLLKGSLAKFWYPKRLGKASDLLGTYHTVQTFSGWPITSKGLNKTDGTLSKQDRYSLKTGSLILEFL